MTKSPTGRRSPAVMALLAATCLTPVGWARAAPGDPRGVEFQVNTYTTLHQAEPAVAMDRDGDSVLVWQSNSQDGFLYGIYAQRYDALGVARGGEFRVNVTTAGVQEFPDVAMDDDGNFVVVWESYQGGASYDIYARRYDAAGTAQGGEFRVNATTTGDQRYPAVAMDADGDFVVAWQGSDGNADGVHAQRYDAAGVAQGGEFQVNTYTTGNQDQPAVAMDAGGDFVVVWQSYGQDGDTYGVYARRYDAAGTAQGGEFPVNTTTGGFQRFPAAAMDADGDFVVAWEDFSHDGDGWGIFAQRYDAAGVAQGGNFPVNSLTFSWQNRPSVAMDAGGGFAVSWHDFFHEDDGVGVFARRFDAAGVAQGADVQVNTYTTLDQDYPAIASNAYGDLLVAWRSNGQDGDRTGIYAQQLVGEATVAADFTADRRSDILWRNTTTGNATLWQMNGFAKDAEGSIGSPNTAWQVEGLGDFDGDTVSDILWRNGGTGNTLIWRMSGFVNEASAGIGNVPAAWRVAGVGDFDGGGEADILWRNVSTGATVIWQMDGFTKLAVQSIGAPVTAWQVAGVGDFDGDGVSDILWRNTGTGAALIWRMVGLSKDSSASLGAVPLTWQVVGLGDFDGGGMADILWRNGTTGSTLVWEMNGFAKLSSTSLGSASSDWRIVRLGDYDGSGGSDILWRNTTSGSNRIWLMDGFSVTGNQSIDAVGLAWEVQ